MMKHQKNYIRIYQTQRHQIGLTQHQIILSLLLLMEHVVVLVSALWEEVE